MKRLLTLLVLLAIISAIPAMAQSRDKIDENTILTILQSVEPDLTAADIDVKMIKHLSGRVKVNLDYREKNAVLYLDWRRVRNIYRWWFERDPETSLILFSSSSDSIGSDAILVNRESSARAPEKKSESKEEEAAEPAEPEQRDRETPQAETEKPSVEEQPAPPASEEAGKAKEAAEKQQAKEKSESTSKPKPEPSAQEVDDTEVEKPRAAVGEKPVEPEAGKAEPEPEPEVMNRDRMLTGKPDRPEPEPQPEPERPEEPAAENVNPFVGVEQATGPNATPRQFISTLLMVLSRGDSEEYPYFLLREEEMAREVELEDYNRGRELWERQMEAVHQKMQNVNQVGVQKIILQKPQTDEIERSTIESLERRVVEVDSVYTYVRVQLLVDGEPAYLTIGGLLLTPGGWRIGGRIEYLDDMAIR